MRFTSQTLIFSLVRSPPKILLPPSAVTVRRRLCSASFRATLLTALSKFPNHPIRRLSVRRPSTRRTLPRVPVLWRPRHRTPATSAPQFRGFHLTSRNPCGEDRLLSPAAPANLPVSAPAFRTSGTSES